MGIKDMLAEQDPDLINLPDLLQQMSDEGDSSEGDAATLLEMKMKQAARKGLPVPRWHQLHLSGWDVASDDLPIIERILSDIAAFGYPMCDLGLELEDGVLIRTAPCETDFGFLRSEIYDFLDGCGLKLNRMPADSEKFPVPTQPNREEDLTPAETTNWVQAYSGRKRIALWEAAKILARVIPSDNLKHDSAKSREVDAWHVALEEAVEDGEIRPPMWSEARFEEMALQADIRSWCCLYGHTWPIPEAPQMEPQEVPAPQKPKNQKGSAAYMRVRLDRQESKISRLESAVARLTTGRDTRGVAAQSPAIEATRPSDAATVENAEQATDLSSKLEAANARIAELERDRAQGKSRSTMLQVIGAMAMKGYSIDIHAGRMNNVGEILSDIQGVGASAGEDALRGYLKEAATMIEKPDIEK